MAWWHWSFSFSQGERQAQHLDIPNEASDVPKRINQLALRYRIRYKKDIPRIKVFYDGSNPSLFVHFQLFRPNQDHCTAGFELERNLSCPVAKDLLTSTVTKQNIGVVGRKTKPFTL